VTDYVDLTIAVAALLVLFGLSRTIFGRYIVAIGTNEEAVRLSGVRPRIMKLAVSAINSRCAPPSNRVLG
jgi:ribose transport system permease protein